MSTSVTQQTVGEALVAGLKARGVTHVFGIPGVHTIELYRGLARSGIRHITPSHEQGAGFMADGYARASGKPGVAFVITGPGLTNAVTAMAQARADSVPMLVVSGVNAGPSLGRGWGHLHELPDQGGLMAQVALTSQHVATPEELNEALETAFAPFEAGRAGPTHIEVPLDVMGQVAVDLAEVAQGAAAPVLPDLSTAFTRLEAAKQVVILTGGGAKHATGLRDLAELLDAPVVQTANGRGVMFDHPLSVPASPSLTAVRDLIRQADCVLALGTELGPTDYDMYETGRYPEMPGLIRVDICPKQLSRRSASISIEADSAAFVSAALERLTDRKAAKGVARAETARQAAWEEIGPDYRRQVEILNAIRDALPKARIVADSTQPTYAGNLYYEPDRVGGWFNSATGYGALGYAIPAAIGVALADPDSPVICLTGDGGAQFSLTEMMVAQEEGLPVLFVIWNNAGYREIATAMESAEVEVVGCTPTPPDFALTAQAFGMRYSRVADVAEQVATALTALAQGQGAAILEVAAPVWRPKG